MRGTSNLLMIQEAKEISEFCLANQITLTAEYRPGTLNTRPRKVSREMKNLSSQWILNKPIFQKLIQALGPVDVDLFASRLCRQIWKYISWHPDSHAWMVDAFQINWTPKNICLPTFCSYRESFSQSNEGQMYIDHINTSVSFPIMVQPVIENVYTKSNFHSPISKSFDRPKPKPTPILSESNISLSSMEGLRQQYSAEGLSDETTDLLESSRRPGTLHHYKKGWRKLGSWCLSRKIDSVSASVNCLLGFLSSLFSEGIKYRTINGYRSAISAYHEKTEGIPTEQYPKVCQLLSGLFNKRPPHCWLFSH